MHSPSSLIATGILFPLLGLVVVGLRFIVRLRSKAFLGIDNWTILAAWFIVCAMAACQVFGKNQAAVVDMVSLLPPLLTHIHPVGAVSGQIGREGHPGVPNKVSMP
jgi:hypothetical protein